MKAEMLHSAALEKAFSRILEPNPGRRTVVGVDRWVGRKVGVLVAGNQLMVEVTVEVTNGMVGVLVCDVLKPEQEAINKLAAARTKQVFLHWCVIM